jgi:hypothetical protein
MLAHLKICRANRHCRARTMALDPTTHRIYLPSAEYEAGANSGRTQKTGTFKILVIARRAVK